MFNSFKPTWTVKSIYDLEPSELRSHGIKAVLTDLDNTLIAWNNPDGTPELRAWLGKMKAAGIPVVVVSNNSHKRVERALKSFDLPFVSRALKPLTSGIKRAEKRLGLSAGEVVLVGDQLLTDVWASHNAGIRSILVHPLVLSDAWNTKINRFFENIVKHQMKKEGYQIKWRHSLDD